MNVGGAVFVSDITLSVVACTFVNNTALNGGAITILRATTLALAHSVFISNTALSRVRGGGGAIYQRDNSVAAADNSTFLGNEGHLGGAWHVTGDRAAAM